MDMKTIIIIAVLVIIVLFFIMTYNSFIKLRTWVEESWSQIDVQLKRRHDLIPNLVNTVKGYAAHEKETFEKVVEARNKLLSGSPQDRIDADQELEGALKSIFALSESYPELKANENFIQLQEELTSTENKVAYSRQLYNSTVATFNIKVDTFPSLIVARLFNFTKKNLLEIPEAERETPTVSF